MPWLLITILSPQTGFPQLLPTADRQPRCADRVTDPSLQTSTMIFETPTKFSDLSPCGSVTFLPNVVTESLKTNVRVCVFAHDEHCIHTYCVYMSTAFFNHLLIYTLEPPMAKPGRPVHMRPRTLASDKDLPRDILVNGIL